MIDLELDVQNALSPATVTPVPDNTSIMRWCQAALAQRQGETQLTVRLVDEAESAELNETYRGKKGPTNVLSFPFEAPPGVDIPLLGDVVICAAVVQREAQEQGKSVLDHWAHMVVHGVLHLIGYDHMTEHQAHEMEQLEREILAGMAIADPYRDIDEL